jgi:hypothetical protein
MTRPFCSHPPSPSRKVDLNGDLGPRAGHTEVEVLGPSHDGHLMMVTLGARPFKDIQGGWSSTIAVSRRVRGRDRSDRYMDRRAHPRRGSAQRRLLRCREPSQDHLRRPLQRAPRRHDLQGARRSDHPRRDAGGRARYHLARRVEDAVVGEGDENAARCAGSASRRPRGSIATSSASRGRTRSRAAAWSSAMRSSRSSTSRRSCLRPRANRRDRALPTLS